MFLACESYGHIRKHLDRPTKYLLPLGALDFLEHAGESVNALLYGARVIRNLARLCCNFSPWFALDHDVKVEQLVRQRGHVIFKTERKFSNSVRRQDIVPRTFALPIKKQLFVGVFNVKVNVERASCLDLVRRS